MSKSLKDRLADVRESLDKISTAVARHPTVLSSDVLNAIQKVLNLSSDIEHWLSMLEARDAARKLLDGLETRVDGNDCVPLGVGRVKYQHMRLLGVHAYVTMNWALSDRITGMVGLILCTPAAARNMTSPVQLVSHFINKVDMKKSTAATLFESVRQTYGWPVGVSYALRNHFVHDGGQTNGIDFFDGPTSSSAFSISVDGWKRVEDQAKGYGVDPSHIRIGANWPVSPRNDLRLVFDVCEREMDDSLGILVGSASKSIEAHTAFMLGED